MDHHGRGLVKDIVVTGSVIVAIPVCRLGFGEQVVPPELTGWDSNRIFTIIQTGNKQVNDLPVVIIGAGPIGLTAAVRAAKSGGSRFPSVLP